jgi:outer membrane lipoprotein carrier protein
MKKKILLFLFFCFSFYITTSWGERDLHSYLSGMQTVQAEFKQYSFKKRQKQLVGSGEMALKRPDKFFWKTTSPSTQIIVVVDEQISIYDPDLAQVTKKKIQPEETTNPASLLSGSYESLEKKFNIINISTTDAEEWFLLEPKEKNSSFRWIKLCFINGNLSIMRFFNNLSEENEIDFSQVKTNSEISDALFKLDLPKGTDVIED